MKRHLHIPDSQLPSWRYQHPCFRLVVLFMTSGLLPLLSSPQTKYTGFTQVHNPNRQWPDKVITKAPIWLSTDLRDGNQSLTAPLNSDQKFEFFKLLVEIGYKEIEVSFPAASNVEFEFTRRLVETPGAVPDDVRLRALAPTRNDFLKRTVDALEGAKRATVCTYICVSDKMLKYQGFSRARAIEQAVGAVRYLRSITKDNPDTKTRWDLAFGLESYNESDQDFALAMTEAVMGAWEASADDQMWVVLATSTEVATPNVFADQVETFIAGLSAPENVLISIHTHSDRGCGAAAAELGMLAGAHMVEGCLFGNGERAGNVDLVTLALNLYTRGISPHLDFSDLYAVRDRYEQLTGLQVTARTPYAGEYALQAFSGHHQNIIRKGMGLRLRAEAEGRPAPVWDIPYLPVDPQDLGIPLDHIIRVNSQSGKAAATWILSRRWGLDLPVDMQVHFGRRLMALCEALAREISQDELLGLFTSTYGLETPDRPSHHLGHLTVQRSSNGRGYVVDGVISPIDGVKLVLAGVGSDLATAALQSLNIDTEGKAVAVKIQDTQQLNNDFGRGRYCALATCEVASQVQWGYFIDENKEKAEALAVIAAALRMYCMQTGPLDLSKINPSVQHTTNLSAAENNLIVMQRPKSSAANLIRKPPLASQQSARENLDPRLYKPKRNHDICLINPAANRKPAAVAAAAAASECNPGNARADQMRRIKASGGGQDIDKQGRQRSGTPPGSRGPLQYIYRANAFPSIPEKRPG
ncbi:hypothetical protein MCOR29_007647 [Pyricularia oryzae]|nr:hypothetical protein MCOR29_007647 [Pyricularia oryzae]KAI6327410.1 hypothetical protein MCOR30_006278 [Pyricularia oryzae]KAI6538157.1 hypothetical protein MCOR16_001832 [Pyricularia oryzae]